MTAKTIHKNRLADDAANTTRKVQEHMEHYLSMAVEPEHRAADPSHLGRYQRRTHPAAFSRALITGSARADRQCAGRRLKSVDTLTIYCAADLAPVVGDYLLCDYPALGTNKWGIQIIAVTDGRAANTAGMSPSR